MDRRTNCFMFTVATLLVTANTMAQDQQTHRQGPANRLAKESSPYLLLHAHNPVDWYPWGEEALAKARKENKPIFLSIGYSSCYWCHVMEREVFSNEKIAAYMNQHFVNIKLDREERPDLDDIYMTALVIYQQATGSGGNGGWPMSMFLLPDGRPFAGGTYFPAESGPRGVGFETVARRVIELYTRDNARVRQTAATLTRQVQLAMKPVAPTGSARVGPALIADLVPSIRSSFDPLHGGVNFDPRRPDGPKFPVPSKLEFLLHEAAQGDAAASEMVLLTLDKMMAGGIRDHLGGGFHRYSTDRRWHVPHFEKMLYDQAQLAVVYTQAWQQTGRDDYRQVATEILDYVLADLTDPAGGFYSARDAETNAIEGEYYVWRRQEVEGILGQDDARVFARAYGMDAPNPFEHGFVLHWPGSLASAAADLDLTEEQLRTRLRPMREKLLAARSRREAPLLDDKVLASWNGLMIRAFADAGAAFDSQRYLDAAARAAKFVSESMTNDSGRLYRSWRKGDARLNAYLDDYAFCIAGLLALHRATGDDAWASLAARFQKQQDDLFSAADTGGYFFTSHDHEELIVRTRNANDSVIPSGNSVSVRNLVRLAAIPGENGYRAQAAATLAAFADQLRARPAGMANMALALREFLAADQQAAKLSRDSLQPASFVELQDGGDQKDKKKSSKPVQARAFLSVDKLPAGRQARVAIYCKIRKDWHINANVPKPDYLSPTKFTAKSKYGTRLTKVTYPKYVKKKMPGETEPFHLYEGTIVIYGVLDVPASAIGKTEELQLLLEYQSCNDVTGVCLRPDKIVLGGKLPVVDPADVKQINKEKFVVSGKPPTGGEKDRK